MNRKNLSDAFGEIDEGLFALEESENKNRSLNEFPAKTDDVQAPIFIKNIRETKAKNRRKAIISATAGIAACAVLAVSLPVLLNNSSLPYEAAETTEAFTGQPDLSETDLQTEPTQAETQPITEETTQEPSQIELYTKVKEILDAEDIYNVEKKEIDLSGFEANGLDENLALLSIYSNTILNNTTLIEGSSFFYTVMGKSRQEVYSDEEYQAKGFGQIFLYDMETGKHSLILKEQSYEKEKGIFFKPMNFVDGWLYYYRVEHIFNDYSYTEAELWRINIDTKTKEKIIDNHLYFSIAQTPGVRSGKYLYFTDYRFSDDGRQWASSSILQYDTETGKSEKLGEVLGGSMFFPIVYAYKDGILYTTDGGFYYRSNDDTQPVRLLPVLSDYEFSEYFLQTIGKDSFIYTKISFTEEGDSGPTLIGALDDDLNERELAKFPGHVVMDKIDSDLDLRVVTTGVSRSAFYYGDGVYIYDGEADCFSQLFMRTEYEHVVYITAHEDELIILTYTGRNSFCNGMTLYTITKK